MGRGNTLPKLIGMVGLVLLTGCHNGQPPPAKVSPAKKFNPKNLVTTDTVFTLDNKAITYKEISDRMLELFREGNRTPKPGGKDWSLAFRLASRQVALEKLFIAEAERQKIPITDEEMKVEWESLEDMAGSPERVKEWMAKSGQSKDEFRITLENRLKVYKLLEATLEKYPPNTIDQQDVEFFNKNRDEFKLPKRYKMGMMLLACGDEMECRAKGSRMRAKLVSGAVDFAEAAKKESIDPKTNKKGGDIGWVFAGVMSSHLENAFLNSNKGDISKPVVTPVGVFLFKTYEVKEASVATLEEAKVLIMEKKLVEARKRAWKILEESVIKSTKVALDDKYKNFLPGGVFAPLNAPPGENPF